MSNVPIPDRQAKYCAHEPQKSGANDHFGKLAGLLLDTQVAPKSHQIDAVIFALQTPCVPGAILDDEVGLVMTIEAGIVITQYRAIVKQIDGADRIYMIRETKSTLDDTKLRPTELAKIGSAKKHFIAIGVEDYDRSVPEKWNL